MPISQMFLYLQGKKKHFLKVPPFFIKDVKNQRNWLNRFVEKHVSKT